MNSRLTTEDLFRYYRKMQFPSISQILYEVGYRIVNQTRRAVEAKCISYGNAGYFMSEYCENTGAFAHAHI